MDGRRGRQVGTQGEEQVLDAVDHRRQFGIGMLTLHPSQLAVQLVDRAIGIDAEVGFWDALATEQRGGSIVAGFCIDFHGLEQYRLKKYVNLARNANWNGVCDVPHINQFYLSQPIMITKNGIRTVFLMTLVGALFMFIGGMLGGSSGMMIAFLFALGVCTP
jgi:hypothetical protein